MAITPEPKDSASNPVPSDKEFPYTFNKLGKPSLADPGFSMSGHKQADPRTTMAAASARYQADVAAANKKSDAQYRADTQASMKQHPTPKSTPRPASKPVSPKPIKKGK